MGNKPDYAKTGSPFANNSRLQFAKREMHIIFSAPKFWAVFAFVVALFTVVGPFGTHESLGFIVRLGYWFVVHSVAWTIAITSIAIVSAFSANGKTMSLPNMLVGAALASFPIQISVEAVTAAFIEKADFTPLDPLHEVATSFAITVLMAFLIYLTLGDNRSPTKVVEAETEEQGPASLPLTDKVPLLKRLSIGKRGELQYMTMRDHYLEVVTDKGSELILMRFGDALNELGEAEGIQIHRSHWVAFACIAEIKRHDGKVAVLTQSGVELPVSRSNIPKLKEIGLI